MRTVLLLLAILILTSCNDSDMTTMATTLMTRKPIDHLTPADLEAFPIWEFTGDDEHIPGADETWVRPVASKSVPNDGDFSVATTMRTASGRAFLGLANVDTKASPPTVWPFVILHEGKYLHLPYSHPNKMPDEMFLSRLVADLGMRPSELFPMNFEVTSPLKNARTRLTGVIMPPPNRGVKQTP